MELHYVYRHVRKDNLKPFYIGIGTKQKKEYYTKKTEFERAYTTWYRNIIWENIVSKTDYTVEIMFESNSYELVKQKEIYFIGLYGRINASNGILCNLTDGGDGLVGWVPTKEQKENLSMAHIGNIIPIDVRKKMSKSRKIYLKMNPEKMKGENHPMYGKNHTEETRRKISEAQIGEKHHFYGKTHSKKTKKRMSIAHMGSTHTEEARKKISKAVSKKVIHIESGKVFDSLTEASIYCNKGISNISDHCRKKYKKQKFKFLI